MEEDGTIIKEEKHSPSVFSILVFYKRKVKEKNHPSSNNDVRICIDPRDLLKALEIPHYSMVTGKEDVANRLPCAKSFIFLDACSGYWQLPVDDKSAMLLTFNNHGINIYWNVPKDGGKFFEGDVVEVIVHDFLILGEYQQKLTRS